MVGIAVGLVPFILIIGMAFSGLGEESYPDLETKTKVLANADGSREGLKSHSPLILQINISGAIGMGTTTSEKVRQILQESHEGSLKGRIKGIFLHINSPGGAVFDSDDIYNALLEYKKKYNTPVVAFTDGLMASGAVWIGCAADKIYATPTSVVGSVGVLTAGIFNFTKLMEKLGIESIMFVEGKEKDALNPFRPWTEQDKESLRPLTEYYYKAFVDLVSKSRPELTQEKLVNDIGARIYPAPQAQAIGFIDGSNYSRSLALEELLKLANVSKDNYQVVTLEKKEWYSDLFGSDMELLNGKVKHEIRIHPFQELLLKGQPMALWLP